MRKARSRAEGLINTLDNMNDAEGCGNFERLVVILGDMALSMAVMCDAVTDIRNSLKEANHADI